MTRIWYAFEHPEHGEIEVEVDCEIDPAEQDVGIFHDYCSGWDIAFMPADCPLSKDEIVSILDAKEHSDAIQEKAIQKTYDDCYDYED
jgi:hypothetical protein